MPLFSKSACSRGLKSLTIYGFPLSQPTRSVLLLCKENSIPYTFKLVDALKGENLKPEFRKIHPAGLVPAIEDEEGFVLGESGAILQYLSEVHGLNSWYPSDFKQRAKVNFWLHWNHNNTRVSTKKVLVSKLFPPKSGSTEAFEIGVKALAKAVSFIESHLIRTDSLFLVGDHPTIADLAVVTELDQQLPSAFNFFDFSPYPKVTKWMQAIENLKSYKEVFGPVTQIAAKLLRKN